MIDLRAFGRFEALSDQVRKAKGTVYISGISESRSAAVAGLLSAERKSQTLIMAADQAKAERLAEDLRIFTDLPVYILPEERNLHLAFTAKSQENLIEKLKALTALAKGENSIVVGSYASFEKALPPKAAFTESILTLEVGQDLDLEDVKSRLIYMGYERREMVVAKGQWALRGGIVDIFPPDSPDALRIDLFDVEIDSLRYFDIENQRSKANIDKVEIYPAHLFLHKEEDTEAIVNKILNSLEPSQEREGLVESVETGSNLQLLEEHLDLVYPKLEKIWDYIKEDGSIIIDDPDRMDGEFVAKASSQGKATFVLIPFLKPLDSMGKLEALLSLSSKQAVAFNGRMDFLEEEIKRLAKRDYRILITCSSQERKDNMTDFLRRFPEGEKVEIQLGQLSTGMEFPEEKFSLISDRDIFLRIKKKKRPKADDSEKRAIKAFTDIKKGDYVVHENHGIGKFIGVVQLDVQGFKKDYVKIDYAGEDILYIPVDQMEMIQKYMGSDGIKPKLNKLTGGEWERTKARVKAAVKDVAIDMLDLAAKREIEKGHAFSEDSPWQREFEDMFPFEETQDQLRSIREIKRDMEKAKPMDRLLCGDVGYGKTEVAARAIFKCLTDGKQAAMLVPTTLLANQHYNTFLKRFENFPVKLEMLSRFRSDKAQKETIKKLKTGEIDLVVGTHRLLSSDIEFKDLGLLIIDEEQRFGVQHKEAIKQLRKNVDVLAISATPIPRTLHMSLVGVRDMSLIEDPPADRYPVQTYVMEQDDQMLKEIIERELDRGGQVFVVFNRIKGIQKIAAHIQELVADAKIAVSHGRMDEKLMEDNMLKFVDNQVNVLVATSIVESGLDIPNANTIVILDADRFGLAQLYQLRGRVGRTNRMAYAYLMYQKDKVLTEVAEKRLRAIREFTEFGSGFHIAMRDLEIRGAGNILGLEQHGHMLMIGYELYIKLVEEAIKELTQAAGGDQGKPDESTQEEVPLLTEVSVELPVEAYIPYSYVGDESTKLHMYKRIAAIENEEDKSDIIDEFMDRFGDIPKETMNLIQIALVRPLAARTGIKRVRSELGKLVMDFENESFLSPEKLAGLAGDYGSKLFIHGGKQPYLRLEDNGLEAAIKILTKLSTQSII